MNRKFEIQPIEARVREIMARIEKKRAEQQDGDNQNERGERDVSAPLSATKSANDCF